MKHLSSFGLPSVGFPTQRFLVATVLLALSCLACRDVTAPPDAPATPNAHPGSLAEKLDEPSPRDVWWDTLFALCGQAFSGNLTSTDEADADLVGQPMTMHVRRCEGRRLEIPFHIGDNRSRTWILTRHDDGLKLQHDHRHEDGSADAVTLYGGDTVGVGQVTDSVYAQLFPVDDYSKELFETHGLTASTANTWSIEVVPARRFSYILRRPGRHFQADFDLGQPVDPPPAPWGHE